MVFSTSSELVRLPARGLVYVEGDGNYSVAHTAGGSNYTLSMQLGQVEERIADCMHEGDSPFFRVGKSLIVNSRHIAYINPKRKRLVLSDAEHFRYEVEASREALRDLKYLIENIVDVKKDNAVANIAIDKTLAEGKEADHA